MAEMPRRNAMLGLATDRAIAPPINPLLAQIQRQRVGAQSLEPSMTNQRGAFDPLVGWWNGQPVTQSQAAALPVDPFTGKLGDSARMVAEGVMGATSAVKPLRAYHGGAVLFDKWDPAFNATGATEGRFGKPPTPAFYLTTNQQHAGTYGTEVSAWDVSGKMKKLNAEREIRQWAKENGYKTAQQFIDEYAEGNPLKALDGDAYFLNNLKDAASEGYKGIVVDFGKLVGTQGGQKVPYEKVIALTDPSMAVRAK